MKLLIFAMITFLLSGAFAEQVYIKIGEAKTKKSLMANVFVHFLFSSRQLGEFPLSLAYHKLSHK
jgi:hypothetical protein